MIEISILGRGGQGIVTAASLIARAALHEGWFAQKMASYGAARRGDVVTASIRLDTVPITIRTPVEEADILLLCDRQLPDEVIRSHIGGTTRCIADSSTQESTGCNIAGTIDAQAISESIFGHRAIPLTGIITAGSFSRAISIISFNALKLMIMETFSGDLQEKNLKAMEHGFQAVKIQEDVVPGEQTAGYSENTGKSGLDDYLSIPAGPSCRASEIAEFSTSSWRVQRPIIHNDRCRQCGLCILLCPEGTIESTGSGIAVNYEFCKGCGLCAAECRFNAISMTEEE